MNRTVLAMILLYSTALAACAVYDDGNGSEASATPPIEAGGGGSESGVKMNVLGRGSYGKMAEDIDSGRRRAPFVEIARSVNELESLWFRYVAAGGAPTVSFGDSIVVFLLLPPQPTGGYGIEPMGVTLSGGVVEVDATLHQPGQGDIVTQAFTAPYAVIEVDGVDEGVEKVVWINQGRPLATKMIE